MDFELDDVIENTFGFGVELFAQGIGPERELFVSGKAQLEKMQEGKRRGKKGPRVDLGTYSMFVFISRCSIN